MKTSLNKTEFHKIYLNLVERYNAVQREARDKDKEISLKEIEKKVEKTLSKSKKN